MLSLTFLVFLLAAQAFSIPGNLVSNAVPKDIQDSHKTKAVPLPILNTNNAELKAGFETETGLEHNSALPTIEKANTFIEGKSEFKGASLVDDSADMVRRPSLVKSRLAAIIEQQALWNAKTQTLNQLKTFVPVEHPEMYVRSSTTDKMIKPNFAKSKDEELTSEGVKKTLIRPHSAPKGYFVLVDGKRVIKELTKTKKPFENQVIIRTGPQTPPTDLIAKPASVLPPIGQSQINTSPAAIAKPPKKGIAMIITDLESPDWSPPPNPQRLRKSQFMDRPPLSPLALALAKDKKRPAFLEPIGKIAWPDKKQVVDASEVVLEGLERVI